MRKNLVMIMALVAAVVLLAVGAGRPQAYAWIRIDAGNDVAWTMSASRPNQANGRIKYKLGSAGTGDRANFGATLGNEFEAIQRSFHAWRNVYGSRVDFEFDGNVTSPVQNLNDDVNTVYWTNTELSPGVYGVTTSAFNTTTGQLLDADLVLNDRDFSWDIAGSTLTVGVPGRAYIEQIAIHEIGHFLGVDHTFLGHASMFPFTESGAINFLSLEADDVAPVLAAYPDTFALPPVTGTVSGRIASGDGTGRLGVQVALIDVASRKAVIAALSDRAQGASPAGTFRIDHVPPGVYWVVAARIFTTEMGAYYSQSFTDLLPCVWGVAPGNAGSPTLLHVTPGASITDVNVTVGNLANAHEPNNTTAQATALAVGQVIGSRIEAAGDVDFFAVTLVQGESTTFHVHSDAVGQDLNPELELRGPNGTTVLATGEFGAPGFSQQARDIESSFFGTAGIDYDCFIQHSAATSGVYYVRVRGTSNTTGGYVLTATSSTTFQGTDVGATRITPSIPGMIAGGADIQIAIEPRGANGVILPNSVSRTVELLDADNADAVLDSRTGVGPWTYTVSPGATAGIRRFAARVDGIRMLREVSIPVAGPIDGVQSTVRVVHGSLVADGIDTSPVEVILRDAAGRLRADSTAAVQVTTTTGTLTSGTTIGPSVPAIYDASTGAWRTSIKSPGDGTSLTVSATAGTVAISTHVVGLTAKATGVGGGPTGGGGGGGGGCALLNVPQANQPWWMLAAMAVLAALALRYRLKPRAKSPIARLGLPNAH